MFSDGLPGALSLVQPPALREATCLKLVSGLWDMPLCHRPGAYRQALLHQRSGAQVHPRGRGAAGGEPARGSAGGGEAAVDMLRGLVSSCDVWIT